MGSHVKKLALLALALAAVLGATANPVAAQATGSIRGKVVEAGSQRPLSGAQVALQVTNAISGLTLNR